MNKLSILGSIRNISNTLTIDRSNTSYCYYKIPLEFNKIYNFVGLNWNQFQAYIITDDEDNIILSAPIDKYNTMQNIIFRANSNYKFIYVLENVNASSNYLNALPYYYKELSYIDSIDNIVNYNKESLLSDSECLCTVDNRYVQITQINNIPLFSSLDGFNIKLFPLKKGFKYKINGTNFGNMPGLLLLNSNLTCYYCSLATPIPGQSENFTYEFISEINGYILLSGSSTYVNQAYIYNQISDNNSIDFSTLKIGFTGDSICAGNGYQGGYAKCLNDLYNLNYQNIGVSGARVAVTEGQFVISNSISQFNNDIQAICIEGGRNDYGANVPLGELTNNYTDNINQNTFYGALEKMFRDCFNLFPTLPIFYVISHNDNSIGINKNGINLTFLDYIEAIKNTCKKYGVYVINLFEDSHFVTGISNTLKTLYTANGDGLHPNQNGYNKFYVPFIKDFIQNILL